MGGSESKTKEEVVNQEIKTEHAEFQIFQLHVPTLGYGLLALLLLIGVAIAVYYYRKKRQHRQQLLHQYQMPVIEPQQPQPVTFPRNYGLSPALPQVYNQPSAPRLPDPPSHNPDINISLDPASLRSLFSRADRGLEHKRSRSRRRGPPNHDPDSGDDWP